MTIYILDQDPAKCAQALDDKSLEQMIKALAQALCNVHYLDLEHKTPCPPIPASSEFFSCKWSQWLRECNANYMYGVKLALECSVEFVYRHHDYDNFSNWKAERSDTTVKNNKYQDAIEFCRDNVPNLPEVVVDENEIITNPSAIPLVMPKKYYIDHFIECDSHTNRNDCVIESYRNYYQAKLGTNSECMDCQNNKSHLTADKCRLPKYSWTRRQKPEWLNL